MKKCAHVWIEPEMSTGPQWAKSSIFSIFWKIFENEEKLHIFTSGQLKYKNSLIWIKKICTYVNWAEMSTGPQWAKTSFVSIFWKVFEIEENHHNFTSTHQQYKNSLIWRKNVYIELKMSTSPRWAKISTFFWFFEKFLKLKKIIIFSLQHNYNRKIHSFRGKICTCANLDKHVDRSSVGKNFNFLDFF